MHEWVNNFSVWWFLRKPIQIGATNPKQTLNLDHFTTKSVVPFHPYGEFLSLPLDSDSCTLQKQQEKRERAKSWRGRVSVESRETAAASYSSSSSSCGRFSSLPCSHPSSYHMKWTRKNSMVLRRPEWRWGKLFIQCQSLDGWCMCVFRDIRLVNIKWEFTWGHLPACVTRHSV